MSTLLSASERLDLSRELLRHSLHKIAISPEHAANPLQLAGMWAGDAVKSAVQPVAQRNPLGLVLGAALTGGVLAWSRPWRWLVTPAVLAAVVPQLLSKLANHNAPLPWMKVLTALTRPGGQARKPAP